MNTILDTDILEPQTCAACCGPLDPHKPFTIIAAGQLSGSLTDPIAFFHPECAPLGSEHKPNPRAVLNHPWPLIP